MTSWRNWKCDKRSTENAHIHAPTPVVCLCTIYTHYHTHLPIYAVCISYVHAQVFISLHVCLYISWWRMHTYMLQIYLHIYAVVYMSKFLESFLMDQIGTFLISNDKYILGKFSCLKFMKKHSLVKLTLSSNYGHNSESVSEISSSTEKPVYFSFSLEMLQQ